MNHELLYSNSLGSSYIQSQHLFRSYSVCAQWHALHRIKVIAGFLMETLSYLKQTATKLRKVAIGAKYCQLPFLFFVAFFAATAASMPPPLSGWKRRLVVNSSRPHFCFTPLLPPSSASHLLQPFLHNLVFPSAVPCPLVARPARGFLIPDFGPLT